MNFFVDFVGEVRTRLQSGCCEFGQERFLGGDQETASRQRPACQYDSIFGSMFGIATCYFNAVKTYLFECLAEGGGAVGMDWECIELGQWTKAQLDMRATRHLGQGCYFKSDGFGFDRQGDWV